MEKVEIKCPNCGEKMLVDSSKPKCFCLNCGKEIILKDLDMNKENTSYLEYYQNALNKFKRENEIGTVIISSYKLFIKEKDSDSLKLVRNIIKTDNLDKFDLYQNLLMSYLMLTKAEKNKIDKSMIEQIIDILFFEYRENETENENNLIRYKKMINDFSTKKANIYKLILSYPQVVVSEDTELTTNIEKLIKKDYSNNISLYEDIFDSLKRLSAKQWHEADLSLAISLEEIVNAPSKDEINNEVVVANNSTNVPVTTNEAKKANKNAVEIDSSTHVPGKIYSVTTGQVMPDGYKQKNKMVATILFLAPGIGNLYIGKISRGVAQLLLFPIGGIGLIWNLVDFIKFVTGKIKYDAKGYPIAGKSMEKVISDASK